MGRAMKVDTHSGGDMVKAPVGDNPRVRIVRPGSRTAMGTVVHFKLGSAELGPQQQRDLIVQAEEIGGKPQKVELRGHTSLRPESVSADAQDDWDLAYRRCRVTMQFLVRQGIDRKRIRLAVAGPYEPVSLGTDATKVQQNSRVEVYVLDEVVSDYEGSEGERDARFISDSGTAVPDQ